MPAFLLKYDKASRLLVDVVQFPRGWEYAAEWNRDRVCKSAPENITAHVFYGHSLDAIRGATDYFSEHDDAHPVPLRSASVDELRVNSIEEDRADREYHR